jgi:hypothetical protein
MLNVFAVDVPPPGVGVKTVTEAVPVAAMSLARICAVSLVLLTKVVVRVLPFHRTTDVATKFDPVAVSVNAPLPTAAVLGMMELRVGTGLFCAAAEPALATSAATRTIPNIECHRMRCCFRLLFAAPPVALTMRGTMARQPSNRQWLRLLFFMAPSAIRWPRLLR